MKSTQTILIVNDEKKVGAFVDFEPEILVQIYPGLDHEKTLEINKIINEIKKGKLQTRVEDVSDENITVSYKDVSTDESIYPLAVLEEIRRSGFSAKLIPIELKPIILDLSEKLTSDQREGFWPEILNLSIESDSELIFELRNLIDDMNNLKTKKLELDILKNIK